MLPGVNELVLTVVVIALLFGATRVPRVVKYTGKTFYEYKKGQKEGEEGLKQIENKIKEIDKKNAREGPPDIIDSINLKLNRVAGNLANKQTSLVVIGLIMAAAGLILMLEGKFLGEMNTGAAVLLVAVGAALVIVARRAG